MINASFILEIFLAVLLIACLAYCWRVERSLAQFRASRAQMDATARELIMAVTKADGAIKSLRLASQEAGEQLQDRINDARALADELAVMGGAASSRLARVDALSDARSEARLPQSRAAPESGNTLSGNAPSGKPPSRNAPHNTPMWNR